VLESADRWLEARQLRNRLIHEYMESPADFAANLQLASELSLLVMATYNRIREDAETRLGISSADLPDPLSLP